VRSLGADLVTLYQYIQDKDDFPVEGKGPAVGGILLFPGPMHRKVYPGDVPWTVVKERKSGFYSDVDQHDFLAGPVDRPGDKPRPRFIQREGIKSMAALLLPFRAAELREEEVVGVMFANYRTLKEFNIDEMSALATFADYAAMAILNARHEEQRRVQQVKILGSISASFAHRMNNLAGTSRINTQLLRERIPLTDRVSRGLLDDIERESKVLLELAERLARPFKETGSVPDLVTIDIETILNDVIKQVNPDPSIKMIVSVAPDLPRIESYEFQFREVLHDMLSNAIDAMKGQSSGTLAIKAYHNSKKSRVNIEVTDTGSGIREDIKDRLFNPGVTTKGDSLGIGLWWCKVFMQASGGDVFLKDTAPGTGSTFVIEIPCVIEHENKRQIDVLVVDDDEPWRNTLVRALGNEQLSVETASSYSEASNIISSSRVWLVVLDLSLKADPENRDGLRLLSDVEKAGLNIQVIVVTGYGAEQDRQVAERSQRLLAFINKREFEVPRFRELVTQSLKRSLSTVRNDTRQAV
jgi:signal transduction histidine kinase/CheY-like chemotaxis protein